MKQLYKFLIRWLANGFGLYVAARIFDLVDYQNRLWVIAIAALVLTILNVLIKPILVIFTLPAIALTLGIFMVVINGCIISLVSWLYEPLQVASFWEAVLVGIVIGLVNYLLTVVVERLK
jgi:putative membrane protein